MDLQTLCDDILTLLGYCCTCTAKTAGFAGCCGSFVVRIFPDGGKNGMAHRHAGDNGARTARGAARDAGRMDVFHYVRRTRAAACRRLRYHKLARLRPAVRAEQFVDAILTPRDHSGLTGPSRTADCFLLPCHPTAYATATHA